MELSAVLLARSIALLDINDLNPFGKLNFPQLVPLLAERFSFSIVPTKPQDFDEAKGVQFQHGFFEGETIDNITVYQDGIKIDVRSNTSVGQDILNRTLVWLSQTAGLKYSENVISRWLFLSQLTFFTKVDLDMIHPSFAELSRLVSNHMQDGKRSAKEFHTSGIIWNFERFEGKDPTAPFLIERRANVPFSENKYYSSAPLRTDSHLEILSAFEAAFSVPERL